VGIRVDPETSLWKRTRLEVAAVDGNAFAHPHEPVATHARVVNGTAAAVIDDRHRERIRSVLESDGCSRCMPVLERNRGYDAPTHPATIGWWGVRRTL
jgi:hypothetical protein